MAKSRSGEGLNIVRLRSIHDVSEDHWDSVSGEQEIFHTHRFIRVVEDAAVENSDFWYLLFYRGEELVATAALSAFTISLDLFTGEPMRSISNGIRRFFPDFMKVNILFCGLPASLGQKNVAIKDDSFSGVVVSLLAREMEAIASENGIRYTCIKEFKECEWQQINVVTDYGYFRANSLPYAYLKIDWTSFGEYLAALRHPYRRAIKRSLKKLARATPEISPVNTMDEDPDNVRIIQADVTTCPPQTFYRLYLQVMERAPTKLETLNEAFFQGVYCIMHKDLELLALVQGTEVLGAAMLLVKKDVMSFALVGFDYEKRDRYDVYFNLIAAIIALAIQRKCSILNLGQTSYWIKQRLGGICVAEYFYLKTRNPVLHLILKVLRPWIFPDTQLKDPRVFKRESV